VSITGANTVTPTVTDNTDGTYSTSYTPAAAGTDNIAITLNGAAINSSPFTSVVGAGAVSGAQSTAVVPGGTPGLATSIVVTGRDAAGNPVSTSGATVVIDVTGANTATPAVTDNLNGTYSASYTPANAGTDNVAITLNGVAITGSPFNSVVGSTADPAQSTATVPAGAAGSETTISIQANDNTGTPLTVGGDVVAVAITGANTANPVVTDNGNGTYTAAYTPLVAGTDNVAITINSVAITGSPFASIVAPGTVADADVSTIVVPDSGMAGDTTWVNVIARDSLGNRLAAGGATVVVFVSGNHLETPPVADSGNGAYLAPFVPTVSGTDQFDATINGNQVGGGPYTSFTKPDSVSAANTTAVVPGSGAIGAATNITIQAKDEFDNNLSLGGATVVVDVTGANTATPVVTDNADGTYTTSYTPGAAGTDNIAITLNGTPISGSPFTSTVGAGSADPAQSTATVPATGTVGLATDLVVQAVDGTGTPLTTGGEVVVINVTGANTATPTVTDVGDGTYTASYTPTLVGTDNLAIMLNGSPILGSPFSSVVSTGGASAANSYAIVPNGTIGTPTDIFIQARDAGNNNMTTGGAVVGVEVTGANVVTPAVTDNLDGTYSASYTPGANGTDDVAITLGAAPILESAYTSEVSDVVALTGRISYESDSDGNYDVWIIDEDGADPINLTNNLFSSDERPHISPDGTQIVFNSDRDGDHDIYLMNANGSGLVQLTNNPGRDRLPVWSPDGTQILFLSEEGGDSDIMVMDADGTNQTNITNNIVDDYQADWSPDGSQIVFYRGLDVWIMDADGSNEVNLTNSPSAADVETSWGPGGITFISDRDGVTNGSSEVYVIQPDGTGLTRLTNDEIFDFIPSWSSDGRITWITERDGSGQRGEVWIMNSDGTGAVRVTDDTGAEWAPKFQP
jgi:hypothetical protein